MRREKDSFDRIMHSLDARAYPFSFEKKHSVISDATVTDPSSSLGTSLALPDAPTPVVVPPASAITPAATTVPTTASTTISTVTTDITSVVPTSFTFTQREIIGSAIGLLVGGGLIGKSHPLAFGIIGGIAGYYIGRMLDNKAAQANAANPSALPTQAPPVLPQGTGIVAGLNTPLAP